MSDIEILNCEALELLEQVESQTVDLVLTDPPYNVDKDYDIYEDDREKVEYWEWMEELMSQYHRVLKDSGALAIVTPLNQQREWYDLIDQSGFQEITGSPVIWCHPNHVGFNAARGWNFCVYPIYTLEKEGGSFQIRYGDQMPENCGINTMNYIEKVSPHKKPEMGNHPAQQPVPVYEKIMVRMSPENGEIVDPFLGTGTTAVVAKKWSRHFTGCDISEKYCEIARRRVENTSRRSYKVPN